MQRIKAAVKAWLKRRLGVPEVDFALQRLAAAGFEPNLIFDVGAYQGDFSRICRALWSQTRIACFEVQVAPLARLHATFAGDPYLRTWPYLLGAAVRENVPFHLAETGSSVLEERVHPNPRVECFPMRTVDDLVGKEYLGQAPDFLKLDVQGYELEVIRGSEKSLSQIQLILAEVNLIDLYRDVPLAGEVFDWLGQRGWVPFDICGLTRRPLDQALWQADIIFVPESSRFRADKRWQSP